MTEIRQVAKPSASVDNPLLTKSTLPRYDAIKAEHVEPGMVAIMDEVAEAFRALESDLKPTWSGLVERLEAMSEKFGTAWGAVSHLMAVKNSDALREAFEKVQPKVVKLSTEMSQSRPIYDGLVALRDGAEWATLTSTQQRIVTEMIKDAKLSGVGLDGTAKERYNEIKLKLAAIKTTYGNNVLDATKAYKLELTDAAQVAGLTDNDLKQAAQAAKAAGNEKATAKDGPWLITLSGPSFVGFMKNSTRRDLRETIYRAYVTRASSGKLDNSPLLTQILSMRQEMAKLLGFDTYAEMSISQKMADGVASVESLLEELRVASFDRAKEELNELTEFAREKGAPEADDPKPWDIGFWSERLREARFNYNAEEVRQYLPMPKVLEGLFALAKDIFGVEVSLSQNPPAVWHHDVKFFDVSDAQGKPIAGFYLDAYSRPAEKRGGAWMNNVTDRSKRFAPEGQEVRIPVAHIVCNGTPPVDGAPSMMAFSEVETMFHEFGHALQHMLTEVEHSQAAGINNVEWDAVELPSQFMENWCFDEQTLLGLTAHEETGEAMPRALFEKVKAARTFRAASAMLRQLNFAMTDIELHHRYDPAGTQTPFDVQRRISESTSALPPIDEDRFLNAFSHIFSGGYSAGYYSYKWAEVLSADAFSAFEEAGLHDPQTRREVGRRFRSTVLGLGGSKPAMEVFEAFRGRKPSTEALLRHNGLSA